MKANVLVATPNYTNTYSSEVHTNHIECVASWIKSDIQFQWSIVGRTFVHYARTQLVDLMLTGGWTHLFWVDDDAVIPSSILPKFIEADKDVVLSPFPMRRPNYEIGILRSCGYRCLECDNYSYQVFLAADQELAVHSTISEIESKERGRYNGCPPNDDEVKCPRCGAPEDRMFRDFHNHKAYRNISVQHNLDRGMMEVDGGGTHCMLVKAECFKTPGEKDPGKYIPPGDIQDIIANLMENMGDDQKAHYKKDSGDLPDESKTFEEEHRDGKPYFLMPKNGTEDMHWCYRARKKGIKIWCDTDEFSAHVGFAPIINRSFREQIEASESGVTHDSLIVNSATNVEDDGMPVRKEGVYKDRTGQLI